MAEDAKAKASKAAQRAQSEFEQASDKLEQRREARRAAFEKARAAGLSTREIAEATGLHFTRVARILQSWNSRGHGTGGLAPMQDKPSGAADEGAATTAEQDDRDQAAVLREVLFLYPETITLQELIREKTVASTEFRERDRIERAVRDLTAGGLLHRCIER